MQKILNRETPNTETIYAVIVIVFLSIKRAVYFEKFVSKEVFQFNTLLVKSFASTKIVLLKVV